MHGELEGPENVQRNWGSCDGPLCRHYALRCDKNFCIKCCNAVHCGEHYRPWVVLGWSQAPGDAKKPVATAHEHLPAVYKPKPSVPEPLEIEENTENGADWTLMANNWSH